MLGMDAEPGIYLQTLADLFRAIEEIRDSADCSVSMSYLEVSPPSCLSCPIHDMGATIHYSPLCVAPDAHRPHGKALALWASETALGMQGPCDH